MTLREIRFNGQSGAIAGRHCALAIQIRGFMKIQMWRTVRHILISFSIGTIGFYASNTFAGPPISSPNINGIIFVDGVTYATIPAALAALGPNGGIVMVPPGTYNISSTIANHANNVLLMCEGSAGGFFGTPSFPAIPGSCILNWHGPAGGTMVSWSEASGGTNAIVGGGVQGFDFEGNGSAGVGLHVASEGYGQFKNDYFAEFTKAGLLVDCTPDSGNYWNASNKATQFNMFENLNFKQIVATGSAIYDGEINNLTSDSAYNTFINIRVVAFAGIGITISNADNERFYNVLAANISGEKFPPAGVYLTGIPTSSGAPSTVVNNSARSISFYGLDPGSGGLRQDGGATGNVVHDYITVNGAPDPIVGSSVTNGSLQWNEVGIGPTSKSMTMYQGGDPSTNGSVLISFDIPTGAASPATGTYALNSTIDWNVNSSLTWALGRINHGNDFALYDAANNMNRLYAQGGASGGTVIAAPGGGIVGVAGNLAVQGYTQLATTSGSPPAGDCNSSVYGRMKVDPAAAKLWICVASGWIQK
jgi:hypothetical protein